MVRTRWSFGPPHKRRFNGGIVKAGDDAESNQNRGGVKWIPAPGPPPKQKRENNPMHSRHVIEIACVYSHQKGRFSAGRQPYCVFATLGGWAVVMKEVASSMAGPSGVGTFSQNGTRMRVPAIGANATSMLRWAARYLITGRSGM
ncbi:hypothetical protein ABIC03_006136 [Bradyrhizobium sp. RT6a]